MPAIPKVWVRHLPLAGCKRNMIDRRTKDRIPARATIARSEDCPPARYQMPDAALSDGNQMDSGSGLCPMGPDWSLSPIMALLMGLE
ncbi:uncharacterized protein N7473_005841 [Penicillium subrubescens]|uniref:Uncharacterized protein n=1 Tax=Penicillium subrubescens TaxID=1316194 RepID=A0A1Q5UGQ4_9EURO|nr:uncharacterized protein N7473_005841 [Penicillium subrubescens]KAJ5896442.1 hypothetical protein N7473_005841 [Penicillium subrubescens]OKP11665.1 hypothetical protein PENSUB_2737 [Penicillium subrubescens]